MSWVQIPEYPNYEMHPDTRVRNKTTGRIMAQVLMRKYLYVGLCARRGQQKTIRVHRLVWMTFRGPIPANLVVNHIDGNKLNNVVENLEVVTVRENAQHASRLGLLPCGDRHPSRTKNHRLVRGSRHYCAKLTEELVREIRSVADKWPLNYERAAHKLGISATTLKAVIDRRTWRHVE